jgi:hypothetical protein
MLWLKRLEAHRAVHIELWEKAILLSFEASDLLSWHYYEQVSTGCDSHPFHMSVFRHMLSSMKILLSHSSTSIPPSRQMLFQPKQIIVLL